VIVGDQRPGDQCTDLVVVPDPGGHRQDTLGDPDRDALEGSAAVLFQVELPLRVSLTDSISWRWAPSPV
jgi:hypothetical protein